MKNIQEIVNDQVATMVNEGSIQEAIEKGVKNSIHEAIERQFASYGSITKQLEKSLQVGLQINTDDLPFEVYNQQMLSAIKTRLGNMFSGQASEKFMMEMDKLLAPAPKKISIEDFINTITKTWREEIYDYEEVDTYATVQLKNCDVVTDAFTLKIWQKKETKYRDNSPDLNLFIDSDGKIRINHQQEYNTTCFSSHEAFVFKLYAAGTILTGIDDFNEDDCDLLLKEDEY